MYNESETHHELGSCWQNQAHLVSWQNVVKDD